MRGRIDGVYASARPPVVEEIKTLAREPKNMSEYLNEQHRTQLRIYGWLYLGVQRQETTDLDRLVLRLSYLALDTDRLMSHEETADHAFLRDFFFQVCEKYLQGTRARLQHRRSRDQSLARQTFPYGGFRTGQRAFAAAVYRCCRDGRTALLQAPTGIGKTMGALFPALKAMAEGRTDRILYLTAKTTGQQSAEDALRLLVSDGASCRSVTLTAKDKICFMPGTPCDPDFCEYARGYYDRLGPALVKLQGFNLVNRERIEEAARSASICPFELSLDSAGCSDVIIADYNYAFDPAVYLRRVFDDDLKEKVTLLIDEAHNLVDRGRSMFSAELSRKLLLSARKLLAESRRVPAALETVNSIFLSLSRGEAFDAPLERILPTLPENLAEAVRKLVRQLDEWLAIQQASADGTLVDLYFQCLGFLRVADDLDQSHAVILRGSSRQELTLSLQCLDPASWLAKRHQQVHAAIFFSATLAPANFYMRFMGIPEQAMRASLPSPFDARQTGVYVLPVDTRFHFREGSLDRVVASVSALYLAKPGAYLVSFPSYAYQEAVYRAFVQACPDVPTRYQHRNMTDEERLIFLSGFDGQPVVGFCVMGGAFTEGIDLLGDCLIGMVVVGVGLPGISLERDEISRRTGQQQGLAQEGFSYAYTYPGITRVLQAAGRVIRSEQDRGVICLLDQRYFRPVYRDLMPEHWRPIYLQKMADLFPELERFWGSSDASRVDRRPDSLLSFPDTGGSRETSK